MMKIINNKWFVDSHGFHVAKHAINAFSYTDKNEIIEIWIKGATETALFRATKDEYTEFLKLMGADDK